MASLVILIGFLPEDILTRLFDFSDYVGGSNRDTIWNHGLQMLKDPLTLLFGAGWGSYKANGGFTSLHNTFLSILCDTGILGLSLLFGPLIYVAVKLLKNRQPLPVALFVAAMAPSFFIEAINKRFFWNAIIYMLIAYNTLLKEKASVTEATQIRRCRYINYN